MFKKYRILKWIALCLASIIVILLCFGLWFKNQLPEQVANLEKTSVQDLPYLSENIITKRGKILAVVTSTDVMGTSDKTTGYELTELARAYYVFQANGFEVDIASPLGGAPPVVIDDEDMGAYDFAFLNDPIAQNKSKHTIPMNLVNTQDYEAVYFVGGKGAMYDFPNNPFIQSMVRDYYQTGKVIGAVCHGPSALVNVTLDNGRPLIENKTVSGFTNNEELLLIPEAASIFPFLLQDKLTEQGAKFNEGPMYLEKISHDKNLITGQNPWSTWSLAENMIRQMGYTPKQREITGEENAVKVLSIYKQEGKNQAKNYIESIILEEQGHMDRLLIAKHSIIAAMKAEVGEFFDVLGLLSFAKKCESGREKL